MNHFNQRKVFGALLSLLLLVACGASQPTSVEPLDAGSAATAGMLTPTTIEATLLDAGVDLASRPALSALNPAQLRAVMVTFNTTLGTQCLDCHVKGKFDQPTPRKQIAARMWSDWVNGLSIKAGGTLYCDSCHQGKLTILDRSNPKATSAWMNHITGALVSPDGKAQSCNSCHGATFDKEFLSQWTQPL